MRLTDFRSSRGLLLLMLCLLSFFQVSCSYQRETPTLKLGIIQWLGYEPFFLARKLGHYEQDKIKLVELQSSTDTLRLLREGVLDAGALTLDEVLSEMALGTDLQILLVVDISDGADVMLAQPQLASLADLKGKRVGVENSAVGAVLLNGALVKAGLHASEITIVPMTVDKHISSYQKRQVDALVSYKPTSNQLLAMGAVKLFDSSEIPNQIIDVIAVRKEVLDKQGANLKTLVQGYYAALSYLNEDPVKATEMMASRLGITGAEMMDSYQGVLLADQQKNVELFSGQPSQLSGIISRLQSILLKAKLLGREVDTSKLFNAGFIAN